MESPAKFPCQKTSKPPESFQDSKWNLIVLWKDSQLEIALALLLWQSLDADQNRSRSGCVPGIRIVSIKGLEPF